MSIIKEARKSGDNLEYFIYAVFCVLSFGMVAVARIIITEAILQARARK